MNNNNDLFSTWVDDGNNTPGSHRDFPRLQMRTVPSADQHRLRSRVSGNVADFTLAYKVWTPREARGVEYRLLGGGRFSNLMGDVAKGLKNFKKGMAEEDEATAEPSRIEAQKAAEPAFKTEADRVREDR